MTAGALRRARRVQRGSTSSNRLQPMLNQNSNVESCIDKSGIIAVAVPGCDSGLLLDAEHVETLSDKTIIYLGPRSEGIDFVIGQSGSVVARSDTAQELFRGHVDGEFKDGEECLSGTHTGVEDPEVVTDGGRDIPACARCGADLACSVEMGTETVGPRRGDAGFTVIPTATCECGASVGADLGSHVVEALVDQLGDPRDGDSEDGDGPAVVTDGRSNIRQVFGDVDYVEYDGEGYRVIGAIDSYTLELDQPGARINLAPADECTPTDVWGNPVNDDGAEFNGGGA